MLILKTTLNELMPNKIDYIIILIEDKVNSGHWLVLTKNEYSKQLITLILFSTLCIIILILIISKRIR
jgi:hypothetical protein